MTTDDTRPSSLIAGRPLDEARCDELVRMFLDQTMMGVLLIDEGGRVVEWNTACERITGLPREAVIGRSHADVQFEHLPPERRTEARRRELHGILARSLETGRPMREGVLEFRFVQKNGDELFGEQIFYPIRTDRGFAFASVIQDVTRRKRMEMEKQALETQLAHSVKMEAMGRLAGGMAHDFNNLLTVILGYTELLRRREALAKSAVDDLREIEGAAQRASSLTSQLLAFSRRQVVSPSVVSPGDVVAGVSRMLARVLGEDIDLVVRDEANTPLIEVDRGQLEHALLNLAVNARDAMETGGRLVVETAPALVDEGFCRTHLDAVPGAYACVTVSDTGCGMTAEIKERVFEPFFTTKEQGKGTGLGLSTVYGFVKQTGGFIGVYSEVGRGTVMKLYFPATKERETPSVVPAFPAALAGDECVLLVEDDNAVRELAQRVLRSAGYTVHPCARPSEATALAANLDAHIDLLLTDVVMPEMGGVALCAALRKERPRLRVLYMSGYSHADVVDPEREDGRAAFLEKPFNINGLLRKVRAALDG